MPVDIAENEPAKFNRTTGRYSISTDSVNGIRFTAAGIFTATGYQTVVMNGHGTPQSTGVSTYQVTGVSDGCSFTVNNFSPGTMATYNTGGLGGCPNFAQHGQFL